MNQAQQISKSDGGRRMVKSEELFAGSSEIVIQHKNDYYRLLVTKSGKLILNK